MLKHFDFVETNQTVFCFCFPFIKVIVSYLTVALLLPAVSLKGLLALFHHQTIESPT